MTEAKEKLKEKEIVLPSGKKAIIREGKGRDLFAAQRIAGSNQHNVLPALISRLATIDGKAVVLEDLEEMSMADVLTLQGEVSGLMETPTVSHPPERSLK